MLKSYKAAKYIRLSVADERDGEINCVIVKDLSRFGREYIETGRYLRTIFPAYGVRFIALTDNIDTIKDSGDDLIVSVKSVINDAYCGDISKKTRAALNIKREKGDYVGACPVYGYMKSEENHNKLVIEPYSAGVVRDIFRMRTDGISAARIAENLNTIGVLSPLSYKQNRGLPTAKNCYGNRGDAKWTATTIIRLLKDETYTGVLTQGKQGKANYKMKDKIARPEHEWKRVEGTHEPIIHRQDFDIVQRIMRLDTRIAPNDTETVYPFSGILICGSCGGRMTRKTTTSNGKSYHYYYCPTTKKRGCNNAPMIKENVLSNCALESIKAHISGIVSIETILEGGERQKALALLASRIVTQIAELERQIKQINTYKSTLYESMVNGRITPKEYKEMKFDYTSDEDRLQNAIALLCQEKEDVLSGKSERLGWMGHFRKYEDFTEIDRRIVVSLIQSIRVISKTEIVITFNYQDEYAKAVALLGKEAILSKLNAISSKTMLQPCQICELWRFTATTTRLGQTSSDPDFSGCLQMHKAAK